jgi:adsorption protein B
VPNAHLLVTCILPLALWILVSGLDDIFITLAFLCTRQRSFRWPADSDLDRTLERRIAILVPLWREHHVIGQMLEHNLGAIRYSNYDFFVGVYPNDDATRRAVEDVASRHPRVRIVVGPHDGPTSKGDCLNWVYRSMAQEEAVRGVRYEILMTHDAEDLVDPESLRMVNWFSRDYAMVQVPVLALPTPLAEFTHGLYCDEFAEFQTKDIPMRQLLGGFLPANGVGTGFAREALERLATTRGGQIFDPACLTEDYENGLRLHKLGYRQIFLPIRLRHGRPMATREYFPRNFRAAWRQRSRWVAGICLQGWQNHGWGRTWLETYWFWRDRKGLVGNLLSPLANVVFLAGLAKLPSGMAPLWLSRLCLATWVSSLAQVAMRSWCSGRIYGGRFAAATPLRAMWGNVINFVATVAALRQFLGARVRHHAIAWRKTEHVYPRSRLGEILVRMRAITAGELEAAVPEVPKGSRLGEFLVESRGLSEDALYCALSLQSGIPAEPVTCRDVDRLATRIFPVETARRWKIVPYRVESGQVHVAVGDLPSRELTRKLAGLSTLTLRFSLVRPAQFAQLSREYFPPDA